MNFRNAIQSDYCEMQRLCTNGFDPENALLRTVKLLRADVVLIAQIETAIVGLGIFGDNKIELLYIQQPSDYPHVAQELLSKLAYIIRDTMPQTEKKLFPMDLFVS